MLQSHLSTLLLMSHVYIWVFRIFQEIIHIYYSHYSNVFCLFFQFPFPIWSNFYTLSCAVISHQHICKYQFKIFNSCRIPCKQTIKFCLPFLSLRTMYDIHMQYMYMIWSMYKLKDSKCSDDNETRSAFEIEYELAAGGLFKMHTESSICSQYTHTKSTICTQYTHTMIWYDMILVWSLYKWSLKESTCSDDNETCSAFEIEDELAAGGQSSSKCTQICHMLPIYTVYHTHHMHNTIYTRHMNTQCCEKVWKQMHTV